MLTKLYVRGQMLLADLKNDQRGVTAIEYAVIAVAIAGIVTAMFVADTGNQGLESALKSAVDKVAEIINKTK